MHATNRLVKVLALAALGAIPQGAVGGTIIDGRCKVEVKNCVPEDMGSVRVRGFNGDDRVHFAHASEIGSLGYTQTGTIECDQSSCDILYIHENGPRTFDAEYWFHDTCSESTLMINVHTTDHTVYLSRHGLENCGIRQFPSN